MARYVVLTVSWIGIVGSMILTTFGGLTVVACTMYLLLSYELSVQQDDAHR